MNVVLARWYFAWQFDGLCDFQRARLDWARKVDVLYLFAKVRLGGEQFDRPVLYRNIDISPRVDCLLHNAESPDLKVLSSLRRVWIEVDLVDEHNIVAMVAGTQFQR